jgi:hypothetical protein
MIRNDMTVAQDIIILPYVRKQCLLVANSLLGLGKRGGGS